jgi:hypothetical protein
VKILVGGGTRVGKTTLSDALAAKYNCPLVHTDELIGLLDWSAASAQVAKWFDAPGPFVIEGVSIARALRKWMAAHDGKPVDEVHISHTAKVLPTRGQARMTAGCLTVWCEIVDEVKRRGVVIHEF